VSRASATAQANKVWCERSEMARACARAIAFAVRAEPVDGAYQEWSHEIGGYTFDTFRWLTLRVALIR